MVTSRTCSSRTTPLLDATTLPFVYLCVVRLSLVMRPLPHLFFLQCPAHVRDACYAQIRGTTLPLAFAFILAFFISTGIHIHYFLGPCPAPLTYFPTATATAHRKPPRCPV